MEVSLLVLPPQIVCYTPLWYGWWWMSMYNLGVSRKKQVMSKRPPNLLINVSLVGFICPWLQIDFQCRDLPFALPFVSHVPSDFTVRFGYILFRSGEVSRNLPESVCTDVREHVNMKLNITFLFLFAFFFFFFSSCSVCLNCLNDDS
jgi:hypothetical protein